MFCCSFDVLLVRVCGCLGFEQMGVLALWRRIDGGSFNKVGLQRNGFMKTCPFC